MIYLFIYDLFKLLPFSSHSHWVRSLHTWFVFDSTLIVEPGSNISGSPLQAFHNKVLEFLPIPPDRTGVTELGL